MRKVFLLIITGFSIIIATSLHATESASFLVFYPLSSGTTVSPDITGNVFASEETFSDAEVYNYANNISAVSGSDTITFNAVQRVQRPNSEKWPAETELNPDRYVQFAVAPMEGTALRVDSIGLYVGGSASDAVACAVRVSTSPDFDAPDADTDTLLYRASGNKSNHVYAESSTKNRTVTEGDTLYIRAYFWISNEIAKMFLIKNVTIKGIVLTAPTLASFTVGDANGTIDHEAKTITVDADFSHSPFSNLSNVLTGFSAQDDETTVTIGGATANTGDGIDYSGTGYGIENIPVVLTNIMGSTTYFLTIRKYDISAFLVSYPLSAANAVSPVITGNVIASPEIFSVAESDAYPSVKAVFGLNPSDSIPLTVQRIRRAVENYYMPTSLDPNCYVGFSITPETKTTLKVDSIGLLVGGISSNGVCFAVRVSNSSDFDAPNVDTDTLVYRTSGNTAGYVYPASSTKNRTIVEGETLYIRAYFWIGDGTARRFLIGDVSIRGNVLSEVKEDTPPTGISHREAQSDAIYPNPVKAGKPIQLNPNDDALVHIYNMSGSLIAQQKIAIGQAAITAPSVRGVYIVKIASDKYQQAVKLIVE
jgi:hypothetical protein